MKLFGQRLRKAFERTGLVEDKKARTIERWYAEQERKLVAGEEIEPPWIAFPASNPIHGWNQGYEEAWKLDVWSPFWRRLSVEEKNAYLDKWRPPNEDWRETLMIYCTK
jgi:hypothetical protein